MVIPPIEAFLMKEIMTELQFSFYGSLDKYPKCIEPSQYALKLFEDVLAQFIDKKGGNYASFYRQCREKQESGTPEEKHFLKLLLASADYQDFSRIMVREARYYYQTGISHFGYVPPEAVEMDDKYLDPRKAKGK